MVWSGTFAPFARVKHFTVSLFLAAFHSKSKRCQSRMLDMHRSIYRVCAACTPSDYVLATQACFCKGISNQENLHLSVINLSKAPWICDPLSSSHFARFLHKCALPCFPRVNLTCLLYRYKRKMWFILKEKETDEKSSFQTYFNIH